VAFLGKEQSPSDLYILVLEAANKGVLSSCFRRPALTALNTTPPPPPNANASAAFDCRETYKATTSSCLLHARSRNNQLRPLSCMQCCLCQVYRAHITTGLIHSLRQTLSLVANGRTSDRQLTPADHGRLHLQSPCTFIQQRYPVSTNTRNPMMHNQIIGSTDQESHGVQDHNTYGNDNSWTDMHSFHNHHQNTMQEYNGNGFNFMPPIHHGLPSESLNRMPPPPHPHSMAQSQTTLPQLPPQLPMLVMPSHATWPSMLTNPNSYNSHSAPPMSMPPVQVTLKTKLPALHTQPIPRKTLTDDDRKRMCQYAEDHPHAKQTDIGARFGVERR
jgi:hypothetical protein